MAQPARPGRHGQRGPQTHMREAASIATSFDPIYYELRDKLSGE
jgi:hypothetical protein